MGLLDDLKKQAEQVKTQQMSQAQLQAEALRVVEERMKQSFQYLNELLKQLAVLKPVNPTVFPIPGVGELKDLQFAESFIDYRKTSIHDAEVFDLISFYIRWAAPAKIVVDRDRPATAQKVRDALFFGGLKFLEEEIKNARQVAAGWRFTVDSAIVTDVKIKADHKQMKLLMNAKNLLRVGAENFTIPATDINEAWLEAFAMTLLGQPGDFRKYRSVAPLA
jgi:hypothetical protein